LSTGKNEAVTQTLESETNFFGRSASDFAILIITAGTMLVLDVVLSVAYYRSSSAPDLRWLLALLDITVILTIYGAFGGKVKRMLLSMKLALTMLFVILILAILGTILPQGQDVAASGWTTNPLYGFYSRIGLFDVYYSRWFLALLYLLGFNLGFCIIDRLPTTFRRALRPRTDVKEIFIRKCPAAATIDGVGGQGAEVAKQVLSKHRYHIHEGESDTVLAEKGRWSGLASIAFHLSFIVIGLGAILAGTIGFDERLEVPDGLTMPVPHTDMRVTNHGFDVQTVPVKEGDRVVGYRPSVYSSDLELFQDNESLARKTITVNDPLRYASSNSLLTLLISNKVNLHQASYYETSRGYVSVLQVTYKPGKSLIYFGFGLMMVGICALYFPHRRIWVKLGASGELFMGGRSNRSKVTFQRDFDRIVADVRHRLVKQEA